MRTRVCTPRKQKLVLLFEAARRRLTRQTGDAARLPNTRIVTATKEQNQIADDLRDTQDVPAMAPPVVQRKPTLLISTVGKILRWPRSDNR